MGTDRVNSSPPIQHPSPRTTVSSPRIGGRQVLIVTLLVISNVMHICCGVAMLYMLFASNDHTVMGDPITAGVMIFLGAVGIVCLFRSAIMTHLLIIELIDGYRHPLDDPPEWPLVSVLLPAYNEEACIAMSIESLIQADYPNLEIIAIDDGSKDRTYELALPYDGWHGNVRVRVLTKKNGGKWSALNLGFHESKGEILISMDADSHIRHDAIKPIVRRLLSDPRAGAVAGFIRVMNRTNGLLQLQTAEYCLFNTFVRQPMSRHGAVLCIPGALGAFRRTALQEVYDEFGKRAQSEPGEIEGPYEGDTFGEDFDLTMALQMKKWKVIYERTSVCDTEAPASFPDLLSQRYRWNRGSLQVLSKVLGRVYRHKQYRNPTMFWWMMMTYVCDVTLFCFSMTAGATLIILSLFNPEYLAVLLGYQALTASYRSLAGMAILLEHHESPWLIFWVPFLELYFLFLLGPIMFVSIIDEFFRTKMRW